MMQKQKTYDITGKVPQTIENGYLQTQSKQRTVNTVPSTLQNTFQCRKLHNEKYMYQYIFTSYTVITLRRLCLTELFCLKPSNKRGARFVNCIN